MKTDGWNSHSIWSKNVLTLQVYMSDIIEETTMQNFFKCQKITFLTKKKVSEQRKYTHMHTHIFTMAGSEIG